MRFAVVPFRAAYVGWFDRDRCRWLQNLLLKDNSSNKKRVSQTVLPGMIVAHVAGNALQARCFHVVRVQAPRPITINSISGTGSKQRHRRLLSGEQSSVQRQGS
jgi:hypothetical protein